MKWGNGRLRLRLLQHRPTLKLVNITPFSWEPFAHHRIEPSHTNTWLPKFLTWTRDPLQTLSQFCPLQTFYMCHFINCLFMTMEKGFIHISHTEREFIPNSSHLDQSAQNLLWITPRTKKTYIKKVKKTPWILNHRKYQHMCSVHTPISNSPSLQLIKSVHKHKSTPQPHDWRRALYQQGACLSLLIHTSSAEAN